MKTIALVDSGKWVGHRPTYLKIFSEMLLELGYQVIALCPNPGELDRWINLKVPDLTHQFCTYLLSAPGPNRITLPGLDSTLYRWRHWHECASAIQIASQTTGWIPDLVFFPWLDCFLGNLTLPVVIDRLFPYPWSGLYFHPIHLRQKQYAPKQINRWRLNVDVALMSSHCRALAVLDEGITQQLSYKLRNKPAVIFPDFTDESAPDLNYDLSQRIIEKANGRKIVGALGALAKRKGLLALIEVAKRSSRYFFVFAGELAKQDLTPQDYALIMQSVEHPPDNCLFHIERIPTEEKFNAIVNVCDVLFAVYESFHHSSNILTKAAIARKPVIVSNQHCMGERVEEFRLGVGVNEGKISEYVEALNFLCDSDSQGIKRLNPKFNSYQSLHSTGQLRVALKDLLSISLR